MKKLSNIKVVALKKILSQVCCLCLVLSTEIAVNGCALFFYEPKKPDRIEDVSINDLLGK